MTISSVTTYDVPCDLSGEMHLAGFGQVSFTIEAGQFVPATPELDAVVQRLTAIGLVTVAAPKTTTKNKKAEPVAAVEEPEE
jgi:hypothetical protein